MIYQTELERENKSKTGGHGLKGEGKERKMMRRDKSKREERRRGFEEKKKDKSGGKGEMI